VHTDEEGAQDLRLVFSFSVVAPIVVLPNENLVLTGVEEQQIQARVVVRRPDGKPLELSDLHSSLAAKLLLDAHPPTRKELDDPRLPAKEGDLILEATLPPQPEVRRQTGEVTVRTNQPDQPQLTFRITVWTRPAIMVSPAMLSLRLSSGSTPQRAVRARVSSPARRPFKITAVEASPSDLLEVDLDSEVPKLSHQVLLKLKEGVDPGRVHAVVHGTLTVTTNDPVRPTVEVPVLVVPIPDNAPAPTRTPGP